MLSSGSLANSQIEMSSSKSRELQCSARRVTAQADPEEHTEITKQGKSLAQPQKTHRFAAAGWGQKQPAKSAPGEHPDKMQWDLEQSSR